MMDADDRLVLRGCKMKMASHRYLLSECAVAACSMYCVHLVEPLRERTRSEVNGTWQAEGNKATRCGCQPTAHCKCCMPSCLVSEQR